MGNKLETASDVMKNVSNGTSVSDAVKNLAGSNTSYEGNVQALANLTSVAADLLNKLPKTAASANLLASFNKMLTPDEKTGKLKISNIVSFAADFSSFAANFLPPHLKFGAYAVSAGLTALSWGISEFEEANEAKAQEQQRLENLFKQYQAELDKMWSDENWEDKDNMILLYKVYSSSAVENKGNMRFKIEFNHELDKDITMSYHTLDNKSATQDIDYVGVSDKNPSIFTVPKGVKEWYIDIPIIDDNEKENDEEFMIVVKDVDYKGIYPFVYGYGSAKGTIIDDDRPLTTTLSDITINEADGKAIFTLSIDRAVDEDLTFYATTISGKNKNIDAVAGKDYVSFDDKKVIIYAGSTSASIEVNITDDDFNENDEKFGLWVSPDYKHIKDYGLETLYQANCTIIDDDENNITIRFYNDSANEGDNETQSKQCKVSVVGLKTLSQNQRVEVIISSPQGTQTLSFTPNGSDTQEFTYYWSGNKTPQEDREAIIDGVGRLITTDENGNESITYLNVDSGTFKIKDDDDDKDDDYPPRPDIPDNSNSQDFASPLVLDLNNNGITSIRLNSNLSENSNNEFNANLSENANLLNGGKFTNLNLFVA